MSEYMHSIVLFSGDDGLPLVFNIQYTTEKANLKAMIEFGGGLCTLSDDAIYLVSPGTKVLNVNPSKKLISSKYIYDCVKQNYLLDTDEYRFEINEIETSDISDNSLNLIGDQEGRKSSDDIVDNSIDIIDPNKTVSPNLLTGPSSNHDFDFEDTENRINIVSDKEVDPECGETHAKIDTSVKENKTDHSGVNAIPDSLDDPLTSINIGENSVNHEVCDMEITDIRANDDDNNNASLLNNVANSPINAVIVSSSQPNEDALDQFDNMVLSKMNEDPVEKDDECLSQSYTVSSSADAQVSPKACHNISAEIFDGNSPAPDSASQTTERQQYIKNLEKEIEQILQKPSPKCIQDKIVLVKYICSVKKLAPAIVLQTLQNF